MTKEESGTGEQGQGGPPPGSPGLDAHFFRRIVERAHEGIWVIDEQWRTLFVNPAIERMLGRSAQELRGRAVLEFVPAEARAQAIADLERHNGKAGISEQVEAQFVRKDGALLWVLLSASPVTNEQGAFVANLAVLTDITERQQAAEWLRTREAQLGEAQAIARLGSWEVDLRNGNVFWSDQLYRILGLDPSDVRHTESLFFECVHPEDRPLLREATNRVMAGAPDYEVDHRMIRTDGQIVFLRSRGRVVRDENGRPIRLIGTGQDISEQKRLEHQVAMAGRLASVGTLASGVGPEINNPLGYGVGNLELIEYKLEALRTAFASQAKEVGENLLASLASHVKEAQLGADRVRQVVQDLKMFSRAEDDVREPVEVQKVLESSIRMAWNQIRHRARLVRDYQAAPFVRANEARLGQVFLNLLVNAAQAIPDGQAQRHEIRVGLRETDAGHAIVEIRDTGMGIPADAIGRIFDPFYSTKPADAGMGLGLSICHALITSLGGRIECESTQGEGTTMRAAIPVTTARVAQAYVANRPQSAGAATKARILVIDDEPAMVELFASMLEDDYEVSGTTRAAEALTWLEREAAQPDLEQGIELILCDLMMPEMSGIEFYEALRQSLPQLTSRVVFTTGGAFTPRARSFLDKLGQRWLQKPFRGDELRAFIQDHLERT